MSSRDLKDRVDYLTSIRIITSDKYRIWHLDPLGVITGIILILWGILTYDFPGLWRLTLIVLGTILLSVCSARIERRYSRFKRELLKEIDKLHR